MSSLVCYKENSIYHCAYCTMNAGEKLYHYNNINDVKKLVNIGYIDSFDSLDFSDTGEYTKQFKMLDEVLEEFERICCDQLYIFDCDKEYWEKAYYMYGNILSDLVKMKR